MPATVEGLKTILLTLAIEQAVHRHFRLSCLTLVVALIMHPIWARLIPRHRSIPSVPR